MAEGSPSSTISGVNQTPVAPPISANTEQAITPQNITAQAGKGNPIALVDGATIDVPVNKGSLFSVTLGGNRTFNTFKYPAPGQVIGILLKQDGTGSRTVTWPANIIWTAATAPTLTTTAGDTDYVELMQVGTAASLLTGTVRTVLEAGGNGNWINTVTKLDLLIP